MLRDIGMIILGVVITIGVIFILAEKRDRDIKKGKDDPWPD